MSDLRSYLTGTAQRELETLRASLDARLLALEAALAHPEPHESLEDLVMDLARVASLEVETSAAHRWLEAQLKVQEQAEREAVAALKSELDRVRTALDVERERGDGLRRDAEGALGSLQDERVGLARLEADLAAARNARAELAESVEALRRDLEGAQRGQADAEREVDSLRQRLDAAAHAGDSRAAERDAAIAALERRCAEIEETALAEAVRLEEAAATQARDAEAALQQERARASAAEERARAVDDEVRGAAEAFHALEARLAAETERANAAETARAADVESSLAGETSRANDAAIALAAESARATAAETALAAETARATAAEAQLRAQRERADAAEQRGRPSEQEHGESAKYLDELAAELDAARSAAVAEEAALQARLADAVSRHDAMAAELDAVRGAAEAARAAAAAAVPDPALAEVQQRLAAADARIKDLELVLFSRDRSGRDADVDLATLLESPAPAGEQPVRRASRYSFRSTIEVTVDGHRGALVDLSVSGAQVMCDAPLALNREAMLSLISDEIPVACLGTIVWSRADPQSTGKALRYRAGILFTQADSAALEAFIIRYSAS